MIGIAIAATIIFAVLAIGILLALWAMVRRAAILQQAALEAQSELKQLSRELSAVLAPAEEALIDLRDGVASARGWFQAMQDAGNAVAKTTSAAEKAASVLSDSAIRHAERLSRTNEAEQAVQWAELGMTAWHLWRSGKQRQ